jgi:hypothetical protein
MAGITDKPIDVGRRSSQRNGAQREDAPRRRRNAVSQDPFWIDPMEIPEGQTWEWKRYSVLGQVDGENHQTCAEAGWLPVTWGDRLPIKRPPNLTELGLREPVIKKGMMLMERPVELTIEARVEDYDKANQQVIDKFRELGQAPADTLPRQRPQLKREYAPAGMAVPSDEASE